MKKLSCQVAVVLAMAALASGCATLRNDEVSAPWNSVPVAAQSTIQAHLFGGTVGKIERETMEHGIVYEAEVKRADGQYGEVKVAEDGTLLKYKAYKD